MNRKFAVILLKNGVSVRIEVTTEPKHYNLDQRDEALNELADVFGGTFIYLDEEED